MILACDLCHSPRLDSVYEPAGTGRGLTVYLCRHCGLVQSLPRTDRAPRRDAAVSSGADWGNVRYGKGFRTQACLSALRMHVDMSQSLSLLDVGSNRGSFARAFLDAAPGAQIVAVEPDERVAESCADLERVHLVRSRIEDAALPLDHFDIIHSCHTIEHLASPRAVLEDHWRTLKMGGLLIADAPNIALIGGSDIVEEWFIDKHLYHFSADTLGALLAATGFEILAWPDETDRENLLFVARKSAAPAQLDLRDPGEVRAARDIVTRYAATRQHNFAALEAAADEIGAMTDRGVALWGAGRLFDALVLHGRFDPSRLSLLIDAHLGAYVSERHGVKVSPPEALDAAHPGVVVVMSRAFAGEISREAASRAPGAEIVLYADLLARVRAKRAA